MNDVRFVISEEDLTSGPGTRLDHSGTFVWQSFMKVRKGTENTSDIDSRRRWTVSTHLASASKGVIYLFN